MDDPVWKHDEERAVALLRAHEDKSYSLSDALSFVVIGTAAHQGGDRVRPALPGVRSLHHPVGD